jgi:uncharacterized protein YbjQ (UPF0145 family)
MVLVVTTDYVPGREVATTFGLVQASTVQSRHIGSDIGAGLKSIVGGRLGGYEKLLKDAREIVLRELMDEARRMGADAVMGYRLSTSSIADGASEVLAYGTAVRLR